MLLRSRRAARGERFNVQAAANQQSRARLGLVVGKRVAPRAVDRNYLKRLAREVFRHEQVRLAGFDVLVRPRNVVRRADGAAAIEELRALLIAVVR